MAKKNLPFLILLFVVLLGAFGIFRFRLDLTQEKRYTLSDATVKVIENIRKPMQVEVYLDGEFPASFRQLQGETRFLLEEFRRINPNIDFKFIDPIKEKISQDTLMAMGMQPSRLSDVKDGKVSEIVLFPYAVIKYRNSGISVPLIVQQSGISSDEQLTRSMENLEYNFASSMKTLSAVRRKNIGVLVNQDELRPDEFRGFMDMALENYNAGPIIPKNQKELTLADIPVINNMDALVVAKPRKAFTETEKLILDQFVMKGGRMLWMVDAVNAEMDTLFQSKKITAYPIDLNLSDLLFNYGVRVNPGLVKDLQKATTIRLVSGEVAGNPQYSSFLWPYYPLGIADNNNPVTRNINPVEFQFPTSIDTLRRPGIRQNVLFESSSRTILKTVPTQISLNEIVNIDSLAMMEQPSAPRIFAVSLEGKFKSAYASRIEKSSYPNFKAASPDNKMIVIADGDVGRNQIMKGQPMPLGYDILTNQQYGNEQFLRNALDYLLDDSNLIALRNRNIESRLLDRQRIDEEKSKWQWLNLLLPLLLVAIPAGVFYVLRKKKSA